LFKAPAAVLRVPPKSTETLINLSQGERTHVFNNWLGAASFDRGVGVSHDTGEITHHIGPDLDADRDLVIGDLQKAGQISRTFERGGIGKTQTGRNGGGDPYFTDGQALIGMLTDHPAQ
jgi:hypothetical protein